MTRLLAGLAVLAAALTLACSDEDDGDDVRLTVRLGIVQSLTGEGEVYGRSGVEGFELAIKELEAEHPGLTFEYTIADDKSSIEEGVAAYRAFVEDGVTAILGPSFSRIALEAIPIADEASVPAISPMTTASGIGAIGEYAFRIALAEDASLPALVKYVAGETPIEAAVLIFDSADAYSASAAEAMRRGVSDAGGAIAVEIDLAETPDIDQALDDERIANADAILLPTITETAGPVLVALREAGLDQPVIGGEAIASLELVRLAGAAADGTYVASTWHPDAGGEQSDRFVKAYTDAYGHPPEHFAAESYAAVQVLVDALLRAESTEGEALSNALAETSDLDTVLGSLSMSPEGDAMFEPVFQQFQDGQLVVLD